MSIDKVSAIAISVVVVLVLAYLAVVYRDPTATTALIALASPAAAVAIVKRNELSTSDAPSAPSLIPPSAPPQA